MSAAIYSPQAFAGAAYNPPADAQGTNGANVFVSRVARSFDAGDLRAVAISFGLTAGLVLAAALACDAYLLAAVLRGPKTLDGILAYQLAMDMLPWSSVFTGMAFAAIAGGITIARGMPTDSRSAEGGFGRIGLRRG